MKISKLLVPLLLVFICSCAQQSRSGILYCSPHDRDTGSMKIDLEAMTVSGADTSSAMEPLLKGAFAGFHTPFPMLLFDPAASREALGSDVVFGSYAFRFRSLESEERDWWVVSAYPNKESRSSEDVNMSSMVLYSLSDGVLSINISPLGEGQTFSTNHVPCGTKTLTFAELRRALQN